MDNFLDVHVQSLNKTGEELCGDQVRIFRTENRTIIVLSDGLGSGVKASILSTLTTHIILTMARQDVPLHEIVRTVIGTLPICNVRKVAYSTFTILDLNHRDGRFSLVNFDNPRSLYYKNGHLQELTIEKETILEREFLLSNGRLERGDFLGLMSDGVLYAGLGVEMNLGWGRPNIAQFLEGQFLQRARTAESMVRAVMDKTRTLYRGHIGDDATFVGVCVRRSNPLMVFTGPPLQSEDDEACVERLLEFRGRTVVCGGTTANIVGNYLGVEVETDIASMRPDIPPIGYLPGVDLVTEGIFTISRSLELMREAGGAVWRLARDQNGAALLALELLQADSIQILTGQSINEWYQNPLLPKSISIRRQLIEELATYLRSLNKEVRVELI